MSPLVSHRDETDQRASVYKLTLNVKIKGMTMKKRRISILETECKMFVVISIMSV